ncbi:MAG: 3-phosphoshikimate 1-carboxyvinyltransferase, partial [Candidatus Thorarchaeota archaeon]|nr:3-phosphoshikimate 1-carboxyvinyltransferase [Candidatus Thorarchaeota archaeon]
TLLTGDSTLRRRPVGQLMAALQQLGAEVISLQDNGCPPVMVDGRGFTGGTARLEGDVSSQFVSALLLACSRGDIDSSIELTTRLESRPYVRMTLAMMQRFGVHADVSEDWREFFVSGGQTYRCCNYDVEGDYSSAAFILAAGTLCGRVTVSGVSHDSLQGDALFVDILREMGARVTTASTTVTAEANELRPVDVDVSDTPDLVPILVVLASQAEGQTTLRGVRRLRMKESDRVAAISNELSKMGASIHSDHDTMTVRGPTPLRGAVIDPHKDHRIAMACTVAALVASGKTTIVDAECVAKSYPGFFATLKTIGAAVEERPRGPTTV